jgi:transposase-like protein
MSKKKEVTQLFSSGMLWKLSEEKENITKAARELGIGAQLIHRWKKKWKSLSIAVSQVMEKRSLPMISKKSHVKERAGRCQDGS